MLYQTHIIDSTSGVRACVFLHVVLKKAKRQLHHKILTPPDIEQATAIGSFGANLDCYYLQLSNIGVTFDENMKQCFFISALHHKCTINAPKLTDL
jgi:hypothetical protein